MHVCVCVHVAFSFPCTHNTGGTRGRVLARFAWFSGSAADSLMRAAVAILAATILLSTVLLGYTGFYRTLRSWLQEEVP